jgi:hypothetical protein
MNIRTLHKHLGRAWTFGHVENIWELYQHPGTPWTTGTIRTSGHFMNRALHRHPGTAQASGHFMNICMQHKHQALLEHLSTTWTPRHVLWPENLVRVVQCNTNIQALHKHFTNTRELHKHLGMSWTSRKYTNIRAFNEHVGTTQTSGQYMNIWTLWLECLVCAVHGSSDIQALHAHPGISWIPGHYTNIRALHQHLPCLINWSAQFVRLLFAGSRINKFTCSDVAVVGDLRLSSRWEVTESPVSKKMRLAPSASIQFYEVRGLKNCLSQVWWSMPVKTCLGRRMANLRSAWAT